MSKGFDKPTGGGGGFFSKLFGRTNRSTLPAQSTARLQQAAAIGAQDDRPILNRARSTGVLSATPNLSHRPPKEYPFPHSLAGDRLESAYHRIQPINATVTVSGTPTGPHQQTNEWIQLLKALEDVQQEWMEEEQDMKDGHQAHSSSSSSSSSGATSASASVPSSRSFYSHHGHPAALIRRIIHEFTQHVANTLPEELAQLIAVATGETTVEQTDNNETIQLETAPINTIVQIIQHINRYENNRIVMQHTDFFPWLVKLTQMLCNEYLTLPSPSNTSVGDDDSSSHTPFFTTSPLLNYFHLILTRCFTMLHTWIDAEEAWRRVDMYSLGSPYEGRTLSPPAPHVTGPISPLDQSTVSETAIQLFVHFHPHLIQRLESPLATASHAAPPRAAQPSIIPPYFPLDLYQQLLRLFGALAHRQPTQQEIFLQHSLHRRLLEVVGFKVDIEEHNAAQTREPGGPMSSNIDSSAVASDVAPSPAHPAVSSSPSFTSRSALRTAWFETQLLSLEVLREICFSQPSLCLEFVKNGGIERMLHMLLWTLDAYHNPPIAHAEDMQAIKRFLDQRRMRQGLEDHLEEAMHTEIGASGNGAWMGLGLSTCRSTANTLSPLHRPTPSSLSSHAPVASGDEIRRVFNLLLSMCCMDLYTEPSFHLFGSPAATHLSSAQKASKILGSSVATTNEQAATATPAFNVSYLILQMVLDVFNSDIHPTPQLNRARELTSRVIDDAGRPCLPTMQLQTIDFFRQILTLKPFLLAFVRTYNVYHTLFSSSFFFLGQLGDGRYDAAGDVNPAVEGSPIAAVTPPPRTPAEEHQTTIAALMRTKVLELMELFATITTKPDAPTHSQPAATQDPVAEMSYLLSLLYQRYTSPTLVQQVCSTLRSIWSARRRVCEHALIHLCWQSHLGVGLSLSSSGSPDGDVIGGVATAPARAMDPFKIFARLMSYFHRAAAAPTLDGTPAESVQANREFMRLLETILHSSLEMQLLALRDHAFVWSCFSMVESVDSRRRRIGIRLTMSLICSVGGSSDILPILAQPPRDLATPAMIDAIAQTQAHAAAPARQRAASAETEEAYGTISTDVTLLHKKDASGVSSPLYDHDEVQKVARVLLTKYIELFPTHCTASLGVLIDLTHGLHALLTKHTRLHQDLCRRRHIFVQLMHILSHLGNANIATDVTYGAATLQPAASDESIEDAARAAPPGGCTDADQPQPDEHGAQFLVTATRTRSAHSSLLHTGVDPSSPPPLRRVISASSLTSPKPVARPQISSSLTLLLALLRALTLLLSHNVRSKEVFRKQIGTELLAQLIRKVLEREIDITPNEATLATGDDDEIERRPHSMTGDAHSAGGRACRSIYGELFRCLVEREWSEIGLFESGQLSAIDQVDVINTPPPSMTHRRLLDRVHLFTAATESDTLESILPSVIALQKSLLVQSADDATLRKGFLVKESTLRSLRKFIQEDGGELLTVFVPPTPSDSASVDPPCESTFDDSLIQGSHGLVLGGFMLLAPLSVFESQFDAGMTSSGTNTNASSNSNAFEVLPKLDWNEFVNSHRDGKRLVMQVAVTPVHEARGAGSLLLRGAKLRYPRGLLASVVHGPPPFHNQTALAYFSRHSFRPLGWELIRNPAVEVESHFRGGYKSQVLWWFAQMDGHGRRGDRPPPPLQIIPATSGDNEHDPSGSPLDTAHMTFPTVNAASSPSANANPSVPATPYAGDTSFVWIQNPDMIPLIFSPNLFLIAPLHVQRDVLFLFTRLVVTSFLNQSHCCKVNLIDLLFDLFPHLPPLTLFSDELVSLQRSFLYLIQLIGTHSISVKQLKRFFALMRSNEIKVPKEWLRVNHKNQDMQTNANGGEPNKNSAAVSDYMHSRESSAISLQPRSPTHSSTSSVDEGGIASSSSLAEVQVRPWYGPLLLGAIEAMTSKCGPDHFWFLDGLSSGLTIPPLDRWPSKTGWAFSAWVRIESYMQPTIPPNVESEASLAELLDQTTNDRADRNTHTYQPRLFHFSSAPNGPYIEAYFNAARHLTIACCPSAGAQIQHQSIDYHLQPQTWYHVCISQNVATTFGTSELNVYINAACVHTSSTLKYPAISKQLSFCFVCTNQASSPLGGLSSASPTPSSSTTGAIQALYGQLGPFYFFDDILSPVQIQLMYALGPSYMFTFGPETINVNAQSKTISSQGIDTMVPVNATPPVMPRRGSLTNPSTATAAQVSAQTAAERSVTLNASIAAHARSLSGKIFLAYNAKARDGHLFLDNTPRSKRLNSNSTATSRKRGMHAVALVGTYQCSTRHVSHVLTCLGGVSVLFPLLAQLDQPIHRGHSVSGSAASSSGVPANILMSPTTARMVEPVEEEEGADGHAPASPQPRMRNTLHAHASTANSPLASPSPSPSQSHACLTIGLGGSTGGSELVYEVDRRFLVNFLHVMYVMLQKEVNQAYMLSIQGFSVLAAQLELASPKHFTIKTVQALHKLIHGVRNNEALFKHAFIAFFQNMKLWIYVKPVIQKYWLCIVQEFVTNYPFLLNQSLNLNVMNSQSPLLGKGTQHLLDRLRSVCWFVPNEADGGQVQQKFYLLHPVTQEIIGMRPSPVNLQLIRSELLATLYKTLSIPPIGVSFPDIRSIVFFLQSCGGGGSIQTGSHGGLGGALGDDQQIEDVLWMMIQLLENQSVVVLKYLSELDDLAFFIAQQQQSASAASTAIAAPGNSTNAPPAANSPVAATTPQQQQQQAQLANATANVLDAIITTSPIAATSTMRSKYHYDSLKRAGMDIFLDLLFSTSSIRVRALSLRGLAKLLRSGSLMSASVQAEMFLVVEYALCGGLDGGRVVRPNATTEPAIPTTPKRREWDESIYLALLSLMLGVHIDADNIREIRTTLLLEGTTILHTPALAILFKLCAFHAGSCISGPPLLEIILQDMMFLLNHTTINMKLMMEQPSWQEWLVELMKLRDAIPVHGPDTARSSPIAPSKGGLVASFESVGTSESHSSDSSSVPGTCQTPTKPLSVANHTPVFESIATPTSVTTASLAGVAADSSAIFPPEARAFTPANRLPALTIPPMSPSPSEQLQSTINAQSYATSLFEQLLIHSLKKSGGWRHYDRMIVHLTFETLPSSVGSSSSCVLAPRTDIAVLSFLVPLLQDLNQLLRRESETTPQVELGLLVDNIIHVLERTQDVLLERVALHARVNRPAAAVSAVGDSDSTLPALSDIARKELASVWTIVDILLAMNAWIVLFRPAFIAHREKERERESTRKGYLGMLGSAAVGVVKGAAGAVTSATNATYRALHDAFDLTGDASSVATPIAPTIVEDTVGYESEMAFFCQITIRIFTCFEPDANKEDNTPTNADDPVAAHAPTHHSLLHLLFAPDGSAQVSSIFTFLLSHDRAYGLKLSSAFRKTVATQLAIVTPASAIAATPAAGAQTPLWPSPISPTSATNGSATPAYIRSNPASPAPMTATTQEADVLMYMYTILCTLLDCIASPSSDEPGSGSTAPSAQSVGIFVLHLIDAIRTLHTASTMIGRIASDGITLPSAIEPTQAAWEVEPDANSVRRTAVTGLPALNVATPNGASVSLAPFVSNPNPSASYLPALPSDTVASSGVAALTDLDLATAIQTIMFSPNWLATLQMVRPMVHPLTGLELFNQSTRISTLNRLSTKIREQHMRFLNEQMVTLQDSLLMVSALSARHASLELTRYRAMQHKRARVARRRTSTWKWMLRSLTNERGPWSQTPTPTAGGATNGGGDAKRDAPKKEVYWKLDEVESSSRMRRKLKVNYRGHDHREASHDYVAPKATKSNAIDSGASSSSAPVGGGGVDDQFAAAILFSKSAEGVLSPDWQDRRVTVSEAAEEDWEQLEGTKGGKGDKNVKPAPRPDETFFDTECSLIHPTDCVGGRLRASATQLHFEARDDILLDKEKERDRERKRKLAKKRGGTVFFEAMQDRAWNLSHVVAVHFRRHQLRRNGMELFFNDHTCVFFVFANEAARNAVHAKLLRALRPYARAQQARLTAGVGTSTGGVVSPLAHMAFVYAGSSGNYGIGGPWGGNAFDVIRKSGLVAAWRQRKISNFDYLMHINTIAGRTYNDLTQYPVFPWILADYVSSSLNLDDPTNASGVFRDLTKPVGALNPDRLRMFVDRYRSLDDPTMPPFMYGTHYSSSGSVLHYLMRLEPFTTAAVELQDGKFDHSDRLFHSIPATWSGVTSNAADVKELIPEFFYLPEMLMNMSKIDFGTKQQGEKIGDVILPTWANGSPHEFVRIHRAALESEYVSLNLHHWIDLIFGFKQQGRAAVDANNVFFHLTYEGGVDIDRIEDPTLRESTIAQIAHFGQTPSQLFTTPHPPRITKQEQMEHQIPSMFQQVREWQKILAANSTTTNSPELALDASRLMLQLYTVEQVTAFAATENPLLFLGLLPGSDRLLSVGLDRVMGLHKFKNTIQEYIPPFVLEVDKRKSTSSAAATWAGTSSVTLGGSSTGMSTSGNSSSGLAGALSFMGGNKANAGSGKRVGVHFTVGLNILPFFFLRSHDERFLLSAGHWDNSLRVTHIDSGIGIQAISAHKDIVTCVAISEVGDYIVTGSKDTTTIVWQVAEYVIDLPNHPMFTALGASGPSAAAAAASAAAAGDLYLLDTPVHVLYGHDDEVTCVSVSSDLDTVVSGSRDGTIMLHALRTGRYTRTITPPDLGAIRWVGISTQGTIMSYSLFDLMLHAWTINGDVIGSCDTGERLYAYEFSQDGEFLLCGGDRKQVSLYQLHHNGEPLQCVHRLPPTDSTIRSIVMTREEQHILVGTGTGKLYVYGLHAEFLRKRFLKRLVNIGL